MSTNVFIPKRGFDFDREIKIPAPVWTLCSHTCQACGWAPRTWTAPLLCPAAGVLWRVWVVVVCSVKRGRSGPCKSEGQSGPVGGGCGPHGSVWVGGRGSGADTTPASPFSLLLFQTRKHRQTSGFPFLPLCLVRKASIPLKGQKELFTGTVTSCDGKYYLADVELEVQTCNRAINTFLLFNCPLCLQNYTNLIEVFMYI